jgi:hypothetical protein
LLGGVTLNVAMNPGEIATLNSSTVAGSAVLNIGAGVTWSSGAALTMQGGQVVLNAASAPASLVVNNGAQVVVAADMLTWASVSAQNGGALTWVAGGIITALTLTTSASLDKSFDARALTITNATLDGDTCRINDPLNANTYTNAVTVKQQVVSGPFLFTGTRTVKVV